MTQDLDFDTYQSRLSNAVTSTHLEKAASEITFGEKFQRNAEGAWESLPYKGFAVSSFVHQSPTSDLVAQTLTKWQQQIIESAEAVDWVFPLPASSFHQTIANTLSAKRFRKSIIGRGIEGIYPSMVEEAFEQIGGVKSSLPIKMKLIGISIFRSAWGIMGQFDDPADYERLIRFRSQFYNNSLLNEVDVKWTRPFIGHLTLGYFGRQPSAIESQKFLTAILEANDKIAETSLYFDMHQAQLCRYNHLAHFFYEPHFPHFSFVE